MLTGPCETIVRDRAHDDRPADAGLDHLLRFWDPDHGHADAALSTYLRHRLGEKIRPAEPDRSIRSRSTAAFTRQLSSSGGASRA